MSATDVDSKNKLPRSCGSDSSSCCASSGEALANLERLPLGERIQDGDFWYYGSIQEWMRFDEAPRNFWGLRKKVTPHHCPIYRVTGLRNSRHNSKL